MTYDRRYRQFSTRSSDSIARSRSRRQEQQVESIVDTGYNGSLTLPFSLITALELPFRRRGRAILADGSDSFFDIFEAAVVWHGERRQIPIDAANTDALAGMSLLHGYELTVQVVEDGRVIIKKLA